LFVPVGFQYISREKSKAIHEVFLNDTLLPLYALILIVVVGYLSSHSTISIAPIFSIVGFGLFFFVTYIFARSVSGIHKIAFILLAIFFAFFIGPMCWFWHLKPFFLEMLVYGTDKMDALFHIAAAQMIKTYGIGTTGLDGPVEMNYHWGSHWIFAHLSNFLKVPVLTVYQLCFPVIIAPLLFRSFLSFVLQIKKLYRPESGIQKENLVFWIVFLAIFIGFFKNFFAGNDWAEYSTGGTGVTFFMLSSESYTVSIIIMCALLSVILTYWNCKESLHLNYERILILLLLPVLLAFLGWVKISTLCVVSALLVYLFVRLQLFKRKLYNGGMVIMLLTTILTIVSSYDFKDNHGSFSPFYFYKQMEISIPLFLTVFYLWTYLSIAFYIINEKLYSSSIRHLFLNQKLLPIECLLVVAIAGFLPSMVLRIQGYDSLYFNEIQMWLSSALLLVYIPFYLNRQHSRKKILIITIPCILVFCIFFMNAKIFWRNLWNESGQVREYVLGKKSDLKSELNTGLIKFDYQQVRAAIRKNRQQFDSVYANSKVFSFLIKLQELDTILLTEKRESLVYVDLRTIFQNREFNWKLHCHNIAFIVPALSGMALIDGIDVTYPDVCQLCCESYGYGYHYYSKGKSEKEILTPPSVQTLSKRVIHDGYKNLILYDLEKESFIKLVAKNVVNPTLMRGDN
jgi:hypothetical protein